MYVCMYVCQSVKRLEARQARGKDGVNGRLEICGEISEARPRNNETQQVVPGCPGSARATALGRKRKHSPRHYRNVSGSYAVTVTRHNVQKGYCTKVRGELISCVSRPTPKSSGCHFLYSLSCKSPADTHTTRAHPQLRWTHYSSTATPHTRTPPPPAPLRPTTCPTTALLLTSSRPLTLSRSGTSSTPPTMTQLSIIPGSSNTRCPIPTREARSCRSSSTPTLSAQTCPTSTTTRTVASTLPGPTSPGLPTTSSQPSIHIPTSATTRP